MNLNNVRRFIIFCAALLAGLVLGAMQGQAQEPTPHTPTPATTA